MRYGVLGAVVVHDDDGVDRTPPGAQRLLLAALLAAGGTVVSSDRLVEALWGDDAPANPVAALHNQVSRLRRLLAGPGRWDLMAEAEGYRLVAAGDDARRRAGRQR